MNTVLAEHIAPNGARILLVQGDITEERVDAIVNAANSHLQHGGGVAWAIVQKGGSVIQRESDAIGYVPVGGAAMTGAGALPCRFVIHAVGPRWGEGDEDEKLRRAARSSLALAEEHGLKTISLPAISSGIFGFPKDRCADILLATAAEFLCERPQSSLSEIRFCLYDAPTVNAFLAAWNRRSHEGET
jgi:O-acetyl-ADP-ribose deacetylase (regulator of RNase III)